MFNLKTGGDMESYWREHSAEVAEQVLIDQARWLDETMKKILSQRDYARMKSESVSDEEKSATMKRYGVSLQHLSDVCGLRLLRHGKPIAQFTANFTYDDGQKIYPLIPTAEKGDKDAAVAPRQGFIVDAPPDVN